MDRNVLTAMLDACEHVQLDGDTHQVNDQAALSVLMTAGSGGIAPIAKVSSLSLKDDFLSIQTETDNYFLPYTTVVGLKWQDRLESRGSRTGFFA